MTAAFQATPGHTDAQIEKNSFGDSASLLRTIEAKQGLWETYAKRSGFSFKVVTGGGTHFDHERHEIVLDISHLAKRGITSPHDIDYLVLHELGHFIDMYSDPEGYQRIIAEGNRSDGLGPIYFRLYNCLMDIYVNTNSSDNFATYRGERKEYFSENVKNVYRKKLFDDRDFTAMPLAQQFTDYLLNLGMESASDIKLSEQVRQIMDEGTVGLGGEQLSYRELIDTYLRPVVGHPPTKGWHGTLTERKMVIDYAIRPIFERLIALDVAAKRDFSDLSAGGIPGFEADPETLGDAIRDALKKFKERSMTPAERAAAERKRQAQNCGENAGLTLAKAKEFAATYQKAYQTALELAALWKRIRNRQIEFRPELKGHFQRGSELDLPKAIEDFPKIIHNPYTAEVMLQQHYLPSYQYQPKQIWLIVVPDLSGSMEEELPLTQELAVALAASFAILNSEQQNGLSHVSGALTIIGFNDKAHEILPYSESTNLKDIAARYSKIVADGGTSDHVALAKVLKMFTPEKIKKIKDGDLLPVLIEITDGDTSSPPESKRLISNLEDLGVRAAGIRFGSGLRPDYSAKDRGFLDPIAEQEQLRKLETGQDTFDQIWNRDDKIKGFRVWKASDVVGRIYKYLEDVIDKEKW